MGEQGKSFGFLKTAIIVLSALLALSLAALAAVNIYRVSRSSEPASIVKDNIITQAEASSASLYVRTGQGALSSGAEIRLLSSQTVTASPSPTEEPDELKLTGRDPDENVPFQVDNMFPGDSETKGFRVSVTHDGDVVLRFKASVRAGYEKLAEVLKCRVELPNSGTVLYDGLMKDMPASLNVTLSADSQITDEVYYRITAYLDTSVGNDYMYKDLIADFKWWIEDDQPVQTVDPRQNVPTPTPTDTVVTPAPSGGSSGGTTPANAKTGDTSGSIIWVCIASGSLLAVALLLRRGRKEERDE